MSKPDLVYQIFVDANPVPAGSMADVSRSEAELFLIELEERGTEMADLKHKPDSRDGSPRLLRLPGGSRTSGWLVATAAFVGVLILGAVWLVLSQRTSEAPVGPVDDIETDAEAKAELWITSLISGDVSTLLEITQTHQTDMDDTHMYEFHAAYAEAGQPTQELLGCESAEPTGSMASVACRIRLLDPVAAEVGLDGELNSGFLYTDGLLTWQAYTGGDISLLNRAYGTYLRLFLPVEYDQACSAAAYEPGTVIFVGGRALTRACAELSMSVVEDVVAWIRDGRPTP